MPYEVSRANRGASDSVVTDWSIDQDDWGYFLCKIWDDWYRRDIGKVFNLFETAVGQWMGKDSQLCVYHEFCGKTSRWSTTAVATVVITMYIRNTG
jgi:uncharacterized protein